MTPAQQAILALAAVPPAVWLLRHLVLNYAIPRLDYLNPASPRFDRSDPPLVSVIIPAKDEEATLGDCVRSVLAQDYPNLEVLLVDDRSTDQTLTIAREFAAADSRVRVVAITDLPPGWTGKTHALHVAAREARGAWFLFVDADTRHEPSSLSIVLEYAHRRGAEMASLLPELRCETFWEKVAQPLLGVVLIQIYPLFWCNDPKRPQSAFANGQYILIRRDAYDAAGGHEAVRDKFVEDIHLARRVKALGRSSRTAIAHGIGSTRMYTSLGQINRGWSRILWDATDRNPWLLGWFALDPLLFSQSAHIALVIALGLLLLGPASIALFAWAWLGLSVVTHILAYTCLGRLYRLSVPQTRHVAWYPLAGLVLDAIIGQAIAMCLTGRVTWRGTAYAGPTGSAGVASGAERARRGRGAGEDGSAASRGSSR